MRPISQQRQGIRHRINCMGCCAKSSTVLAHTNSSPMLSREIFSTKSHRLLRQPDVFQLKDAAILNAINMLPVTQHGNLLCYNLGEMLNQLPWLTQLYCFLNEQQYITEFSAWFKEPLSFTPLNQKEEHRLLVGARADACMQFSDSKTHCKNAFAVSADI